MQLIQPKLTKRQDQPPRTTSQASSPPSGKSAGLIPPCTGSGFGMTPFLSRSASASTSDSGNILASVCLFWLPMRFRECLSVDCLFSPSSYGILSGVSGTFSSATMVEDLEDGTPAIVDNNLLID